MDSTVLSPVKAPPFWPWFFCSSATAELNAVTKLESALETELRLAETVTVVGPV